MTMRREWASMLTRAQGEWNAGAGIKHNARTLCAVRCAHCPGLRPRIMGAMLNARRTGLTPRADVACAASLIAMDDQNNSGPICRARAHHRCSHHQTVVRCWPFEPSTVLAASRADVNGRRRPPLTPLRAVLIRTGQQRSRLSG